MIDVTTRQDQIHTIAFDGTADLQRKESARETHKRRHVC
jgi:hypothetical protein